MSRQTKTGRPRTSIGPGAQLKDKNDKTVAASTVKFTNVHYIKNKEDFIHLITNVLKQYSKQRPNLLQLRAGATTVTCVIVSKQVATTLARKVTSAFKHYKPEMIDRSPRKKEHLDILVTFQQID